MRESRYQLSPQKRQRRAVRENSGIVIIIALWILVFLVIVAAGLSRRGAVNTQLSQLAVGQLRANFLVLSAVRYAQMLITQDGKDEKSSAIDTSYQCGFVLPKGSAPEQLFKNVTVPQGSFDIVNSWQRKGGALRYGFSDEESRINLNAITPANYQVLKYLIMNTGFEEEKAQMISASVVDWADQDDNVFLEGYGEENAESSPSGRRIKNAPFQSLEELLLIKGMTLEIFQAVKDDLTVFPTQSGMSFNLNTATPRVLRALAQSFTGVTTNTEISDADLLVEKILRLRTGPDGIDGTADDRPIVNEDLRLNNRETAIMAQMQGYQTNVSSLLRMGIRAVDTQSKVESLVEVVLSREDGRIVYWRKIK